MSNNHNHRHEAARPTTDYSQHYHHQQQDQPGLEVDARADTAGLQLHRDVEAEDTTKQAVEPGPNGGYFPDEHYAAPGLQAAPAPALVTSDGKYENGRGLHPATATAGGGGGGATYPAEAEATAPMSGTKKPNRRRVWIILGVIAAILTIIGAVLGGVLGSRAANSSSSNTQPSSSSGDGDGDTAAGNSGNDTAPPSAPLRSIRPGSALAVTGWRDGPDFHIRLFYQGPDQLLRYSNFSSREDGGWGARRPVLLDQLEHKAAVNTSLAAAASVESREIVRLCPPFSRSSFVQKPSKGEEKLFYLDTTNTIRLQLFRPGVRAAGNGGQLNKYPVKAAPGSRLGAYWPSLLSQDGAGTGGQLRWTRYWGVNQQNKPFWEDQGANVTASPNSGLVVVPASSKYGNSGGFLFRRGDGKVGNSLADHSEGGLNRTAWGKGELPPSSPLFLLFCSPCVRVLSLTVIPGDLTKNLNGLTIPEDSPLAAFTVARSGDNPENFVNTYILYVGPKGAVNMVWQDGENSGWKGPVQYPEAFGGADAGTDVACVTPAAWAGSNFGYGEIGSAYDMSRCYFQAGGGRVREVQFDGSTWKNRGYLPIA
ncbi:uncharacterized protein PG986_013988 [Apiospora aurea]|uniref:Fucose-specific lectin n=1 Tax=Apiospora aurea TaxID=335848 RepID=A0ABR1PXP8_9PEZI